MSRGRADRGEAGERPAGALIGLAGILGVAVLLAVAILALLDTDSETLDPVPPRADADAGASAGEGQGRDGDPPAPAVDRPPRLFAESGHRIAAVRPGERVGVHERPSGKLVERAGPETEFGSRQTFSVLRRKGEWLKVTTSIAEDNRALWIEADPSRLEFGTTPLSLHASLSDRRVELRRGEKVVRSFEVTVGAAGTSTPPGRFAVTDLIVGGLNPVYGCCAIALSARQPDLPEGWIGGDRVAIHGTTGPIGSASSAGCLRATNDDARALTESLPLGTPVFIEA